MKHEIQTRTPENLNQFKVKVVGPLTFRQTVCGAIAVGIDFLILPFVKGTLSYEAITYLLAFIDLPILALAFDIEGISVWSYFTTIFLRKFMRVRHRLYEAPFPIKEKQAFTRAEIKKVKREQKKNKEN